MSSHDEYVFAPPARPSLPIVGSDALFPVRRVFCIGRNYADHAREMGVDPDREPPCFFSKPSDALFTPGVEVPYPPMTHDLQHEVELVVAIGTGGTSISGDSALSHVFGYAVGIDLTRRDLQAVAKELRQPWDLAKGFDASGPCSAIAPVSSIGHPDRGAIWLSVNGEERQRGDLSDQILSIADIIAVLSTSVTLAAGDVIFTGTPAGVGTIVAGDRVSAGVDGVAELEFEIST